MWKMLLYKSWLETRSRFIWCLSLTLASISHAVLTAPSVIQSVHHQLPWVELSFASYLWIDVYAGSLLAAWVALVAILAAGGLRSEQSSGASAFTLSLPIRRRRFLLAQLAVGKAESIVFGFLPAFLIPELSSLVTQTYPISQALLHSVLLVGAGELVYGWAFLLSQMIQKQLSSLAISLSTIGAFFVLVKRVRMLDHLDIFDIMTGADLVDRHTFVFHGPLPWLSLVTIASLSWGMVWISILLIERHDF